MNRKETAIGNGHGGLMASVLLDEPSLGLSPVLVTEIFHLVEPILTSASCSTRWVYLH